MIKSKKLINSGNISGKYSLQMINKRSIYWCCAGGTTSTYDPSIVELFTILEFLESG